MNAREITRIPVGMRPGVRQLNDASLRVSMTEAVPPHMRPNMREITELQVPLTSRRKRLATALMNFVCQEADANRITLLLTAAPQDADGMDGAQLVAWYERFGFQALELTDDGMLMARRVFPREPGVIATPAVGAIREAIAESLLVLRTKRCDAHLK